MSSRNAPLSTRDDTKNDCVSPNVREYGFWENFASGIRNLGFEIRNTAQGIQNSSNKWKPEIKFHWQRSGIQHLESANPRRGPCLGFPNVSYVRQCVADYFARRLGYTAFSVRGIWYAPLRTPSYRGGDSHMKGVGMFVVSLRGVNFGFWSHLGCSGQNAIIFSREGLV